MYLFIDTETGGLNPQKYSLLTLSCDLVKELGDAPISQFNVKIAHDPYRVGAGALGVNGINLAEHHKQAATIYTVQHELQSWLKQYHIKPQPVGWNVAFDLGFIHAQLLEKLVWDTVVDYHTIDVCSLVELLIIQGKLPKKRRLVDVAQHFGLDISGAHDAAFDNHLCRAVLQKLVEL